MSSMVRISGGGLFEGLYRFVMRRNSVYVTFVIAGAFLGEREKRWTVEEGFCMTKFLLLLHDKSQDVALASPSDLVQVNVSALCLSDNREGKRSTLVAYKG